MTVRSKKLWRDWLVYAAARAAQSILQSLPWSTGRWLAGLLGELGYLLDRRRRKENAVSNLRQAFPSLDGKGAKRILRGAYRHLVQSILDALNFARFVNHWDNEELFECVGWEVLRRTPRNTGVLFVTAHFGHWEMLGIAMSLIGYPIWTVARGFRNVFVERYVRKLREGTGQRIVGRHGSLRRIIGLLRSGHNVGFVIDQDARRQGIFVEFFGRPAKTVSSVARIAISTGAPVAFCYGCRIAGQNRFRFVLKDIILPRRGADKDAEVHRITQRFTRDLEDLIRRVPQEWFWLHRRWKTYPGKHPRSEARLGPVSPA